MQNYSSKNTSVNTTKLPALYNKVCWDKLSSFVVLDWGCGRDTTLIRKMLCANGLTYMGYDPNWKSTDNNRAVESCIGRENVIFICSNVLNVIDDDNVVQDICNKAMQHKYFFITVYEGNKSGVGKRSKEDCYQRNEQIKSYLRFFNNDKVCIKKGILTNAPEIIMK